MKDLVDFKMLTIFVYNFSAYISKENELLRAESPGFGFPVSARNFHLLTLFIMKK